MSALAICVGGVRVGLLERLDAFEHRFSFDRAWLETPDRPILGQLFEDRRPHDIVTSGFPCWFAHLLPQGPLRRALFRQIGGEEADEFDLFQSLGEDLPGAVAAYRAEPSLRPRSETLERAPEPKVTDFVQKLHFSLAGAQWKLSVREGERGMVVPVRGESGHFIAKFDDPQYPGLPRIEHVTMEWARLCGVDTPPFRMVTPVAFEALPEEVPVGNGDVFVIRRFDRVGDHSRVHMEDFGQVLDRTPGEAQYMATYEQVGAALQALSPEDMRAFCERIVFCALAGNGDAHLKNWTLFYPDKRHARLSPAYDLVATVLYPRVEDQLALELAGSRRFEDVSERSFEPLARLAGVDANQMAIWTRAMAERVRQVFQEQCAEWPLTLDERTRLTRHLVRVPLGK